MILPGIIASSMYEASAYVASAVDYRGLGFGDSQTRNSLTGILNGKAGTFSAWIRVDGDAGTQRYIFAMRESNPGFLVTLETSNKIRFLAYNNDLSLVLLQFVTTPTYPVAATWINILSSWSLATGLRHLYINDVAVALDVNTTNNDNIAYQKATAIGVNSQGPGNYFNGCMSELFFHTAYIDLSIEANRRKFISAIGKPVSLGANGSTPLGIQPLLYAPTSDATGTGNKGTGGAFTLSGVLGACSNSPSS